MKLVIPEAESQQLLEFVRRLARVISKELTVIDVGRAAARAGCGALARRYSFGQRLGAEERSGDGRQ